MLEHKCKIQTIYKKCKCKKKQNSLFYSEGLKRAFNLGFSLLGFLVRLTNY